MQDVLEMRLLLINGPNLNLLGKREIGIYGKTALETIESSLKDKASSQAIELEFFQSNFEGALVERIHQGMGNIDGILINAGAYTHTSIALRDALLGTNIPYVELHLSNTQSRESFRYDSFLADRAIGVVAGFGPYSYELAMQGLVNYLRTPK